ncbi:SEC-C metal-binding domain-containing protein [Streptomyces violascens]|uniref:SEC-C metal-binding domain-containing protein n=1 Tax=Streptomyces violascens TaxID=67381 RepID=UPI003665C8AC
MSLPSLTTAPPQRHAARTPTTRREPRVDVPPYDHNAHRQSDTAAVTTREPQRPAATPLPMSCGSCHGNASPLLPSPLCRPLPPLQPSASIAVNAIAPRVLIARTVCRLSRQRGGRPVRRPPMLLIECSATLLALHRGEGRFGRDPLDADRSGRTPRDSVTTPYRPRHLAALWPPPRNGPCWCGSDRKYKKCHGNPART